MKHTVRNDIHAGFLGFFLDFARRWWKRPGRSEAIDRAHGVMDGIQDLGIRVVDFFTFVSDWTAENRYISGMEPWKRSGRKQELLGAVISRSYPHEFRTIRQSFRQFDFDRPRNKFFKCYKKFCELLLEHRLRPCATLLLRPPYLHTLLGNNVQNIRSYNNSDFLHYMIGMSDKITDIEFDVFGPSYGQWRKTSNEWSHHDWNFGSTRCERGHFVADFHRDMFDHSPHNTSMLSKQVIDITASEFAKAYFSQPSRCPYCDEVAYDRPDLRGIPGDPDGVRVLLEQHGYSVHDNLNTDAEHAQDRHLAHAYQDFLHHNPHVQRIRLHEDGGGGPTAKGYAVGHFKISDNDQAYDFARVMWGMAKDAGKRVIYAPFPLETLVRESDGEFREDYSVERINWQRLREIIKAYGEVYGG